VLRCILRHCDVPVSTPHSSGFARLEFEAFYFVVCFSTFYGIINYEWKNKYKKVNNFFTEYSSNQFLEIL